MDLNSGAPLVPRAGDATTVMQRGIGSPLSWDGVFETQRGFQIAVHGGVECPFEHEEDVLLASGPLGSRLASLARFKGLNAGRAIFTKLSPWRPVDTRANPRYRTNMSAFVRDDSVEVAASVLDVSAGGAALAMECELEPRTGVEMLDLKIGTRPDAPYLPCRVVSRSNGESARLLHVRFGTMTVQAHAYVSQLIGELCAALEPGLGS